MARWGTKIGHEDLLGIRLPRLLTWQLVHRSKFESHQEIRRNHDLAGLNKRYITVSIWTTTPWFHIIQDESTWLVLCSLCTVIWQTCFKTIHHSFTWLKIIWCDLNLAFLNLTYLTYPDVKKTTKLTYNELRWCDSTYHDLKWYV